MKKRFWALLLAVMMVVSVLPTSAFAVDGTVTPKTRVSTADDSPVQITKSVTDNGNDTYTIDMEAFVTGSVKATNPDPLDIILVLDQSGSMAYDFDGDTTKNNQKRRQYAMKAAVETFIKTVAEHSSEHRIAIVTFGSNASTLSGWTEMNDAGKGNLINAVKELPDQPNGATNVAAGMTTANSLLGSSVEGHDKAVIVFTDGVPTTSTQFSTKVADDAISTAKSMKEAGVIVYTIGIFNGADPSELHGKKYERAVLEDDICNGNVNEFWGATTLGEATLGNDFADPDVPAGNRFLNYLSNNFMDANKVGLSFSDRDGLLGGYKWTITANFTRSSDKYYLTAADSNALNSIFGQIAEEIVPAVTAGEDSILMDTVSEWFTPVVPAGSTGVTVEVYDQNGPVEDANVTAEIDGQEVIVTGFDYSANPVIETDDGGWTGQKLRISFIIEPDVDAKWKKGTNLYPTNVAGDDEEDNAGLSYGNEKTELTESPEVEVTAYTVTYTITGDAPAGYPAPTGGVYLPGAKVKVAAVPEEAGYTFDGWKINGENAADFTMPSAHVELTGVWSKNPPATVTVTYTDGVDGQEVFEDQVTTVNINTAPTAFNGDTATLTYTDENGDKYIFVRWDPMVAATVSEDTVYIAQWEKDNWHDANPNDPEDKDSDKGGDGIPDKYQAVIKYVSENDAKGSVSFAMEVVTVKDETYFSIPVANGKIKITGSKATAADGYLFKNWTSDENLTFEGASVAELKGQRISGVQGGQTYTFTAHFDEAIPGLELSKTVKSIGGVAVSGSELPMAVEGDVIVWTISVKNTGNCSLKDITVKDVLKDEDGKDLSGVSVFPVGTYGNIGNELDLPFTIGDYLAAGDTAVYEARYTVTANDAGKTLINSVSATGADSVDAPGVTVKNPALSVTKTVNKTSVTVGDTVKYTIKVTNTGNVDLTNVNVVEAFGGDFSKIFDLTGATKASTFNGFMIGELKAGETKEITFSYKTTKRETLTNSVVVEGTYEPGKTVENEAKSPDVTVKSEPITPVGPSKPQLNYEDHYAYVVGYPDGLVHPERNITRAEVATIFFRMLLDESREYFWAQENDFSDVAETDWFNNAVSTLANAQLINGYPDGSYRPNANITRAEFATIAIRFFLDEDVEIEENNLSDVKGHWAEANINLAYALELINGYPDGTFRPDQKITRAEAMAIVNRVLKRAPEKDHLLKDMIEWPDNLNTAAWYYADVQEATNSHKFHMDKEEEYEIWTELLPVRDWVALEQEWSKANSSKNPGEVVDIKITTPEAGDNGLKLD